MKESVVAVYVPVILTVMICAFARQIGERLGIIDYPDDGRKSHSEPTPLVGGIAIMVPIAVWATIQIFGRAPQSEGLDLAILLCAGGVAVVGFMDDQRMISPAGRLILLAIFSFVALRLDPGLLASRVHTLGWGWAPVAPALAALLTVLALMGFSSAVNMVDGVTGLVLSLICIWSVCLALTGSTGTDAAELVAAASLVTLLFNVRGRLFLGDSGAFAVAFLVGLLAINAHNEGRVALETVVAWFLLPVLDCLRLIPVRLLQGRSPFRPDRLHFHYRLGERIGGRRAIGLYVGVVATTSLTASLRPGLSIACICIQSVLYLGFVLADAMAGAEAALRAPGQTGSANVVLLREKKHPGANH